MSIRSNAVSRWSIRPHCHGAHEHRCGVTPLLSDRAKYRFTDAYDERVALAQVKLCRDAADFLSSIVVRRTRLVFAPPPLRGNTAQHVVRITVGVGREACAGRDMDDFYFAFIRNWSRVTVVITASAFIHSDVISTKVESGRLICSAHGEMIKTGSCVPQRSLRAAAGSHRVAPG